MIPIDFKLHRPGVWPKNYKSPPPMFQAHRGIHDKKIKENTLESFQKAKELKFSMIELDVRLTYDNHLVVHHDSSLKRVWDIEGCIEELSLDKIKENTKAPSLSEVLRSHNTPQWVNIELKTKGLNQFKMVKSLMKVLSHSKSKKKIIISSFDPICLFLVKRFLPNYPRALIASFSNEVWNKIYLKKLWGLPLCQPHILHLDYSHINKNRFLELKSQGYKMGLWTVNNKKEAKKWLDLGAYSIITDIV